VSWLKRRLRGFLAPTRTVVVVEQKAPRVRKTRVITGETPPIPFKDLMAMYAADPAATNAVESIASKAVGAGFYTVADDPRAKELVDSFCEDVGLDEMIQTTARECIAFGNSFWELIEPDGLERVELIPLDSIARIRRDRYGRVLRYEQTPEYGRTKLEANRVLHFKFSPLGGSAFGFGVMHSVALGLEFPEEGFTRPSYVKMKSTMHYAMIEQFKRFSAPNELWIFPELPADQLDATKEGTVAYHIKNLPMTGARFVTSCPDARVILAVPERARGFDAYAEALYDEYILGLRSPSPKLMIKRGFTEASAKVAAEFLDLQARILQRFLKRRIERYVFAPLLEQHGFDPREARVRLYWGEPAKVEYRVEDLLKAYELGVITLAEVRDMLITQGWSLKSEEGEGG